MYRSNAERLVDYLTKQKMGACVMVTGTITLQFPHYRKEVEATIVGQWGVHKDEKTYGVTHIPTGKNAYHGIPRKRDAMALAKGFDALGIDNLDTHNTAHMNALITVLREWRDAHPR